MSAGWMGYRRVTVMTLIVALAACGDARDVGGPSLESDQAVLSTTGASYDLLKGTFPDPAGNGASCDVKGQEPGSKLQSAAWIDSGGGELRISGGVVNGRPVGHVLTVPPLTVSSPTLFCMRLMPTNHMQVKLEALAPDAGGNVVNVGAAGFHQPVRLTLSYAPLNLSLTQARRVVVVYDRENGAPVELTLSLSVLLVTEVKAEIEHFSKYAMAVD